MQPITPPPARLPMLSPASPLHIARLLHTLPSPISASNWSMQHESSSTVLHTKTVQTAVILFNHNSIRVGAWSPLQRVREKQEGYHNYNKDNILGSINYGTHRYT